MARFGSGSRHESRSAAPHLARRGPPARFPLWTVCGLCNHSALLPIDVAKDLPDEATMQDIAVRLRCTKCHRPRGGSVMPLSRLWIAHLRQTGQMHRLPYWTPFAREADDAGILAAFAERGALPE
jgi:hypothetical protein